jgi:hypothetical protein
MLDAPIAPSFRRLICHLAVVLTACFCIAAGEDDLVEEPARRADPNNEGGQRYGADEDHEGYPVVPGAAGDFYFDASAENRAYSPNWTGAFVGFGALAGAATLQAPFLEQASPAPVVGAFVGACTVSALFEAQLAWWRSQHQTTFDGGIDSSLTRNTLSASVGVHPLFLWLISSGRSNFTIADFTAFVGPSLDLMSIQGDGLDLDYRALGYHLGARMDTYIDSPQDGGALWVGLEYRYNVTSGSAIDERLRRERAQQHLFVLRFSWRVNGLMIPGDNLAH